ncbi:hypothetical protein G3R49_00425 [Shewanella sp. WXL01]|uniref:Uncharacterized protein n=1 Tax=Shewanella maritima TaxID=2520507 RepID=A0A411PGW4_9GAMM|nr:MULTISPECIES: hypothetical protein [Shewanella]NKF49040.1 hypothetical protein [Shewanella sp. WXL01]QBF82817.1 hypothetical protein EXU30_09015 [Shewanella maritima]
MIFSKKFNLIGLLGLAFALLLIYVQDFASASFILKPYDFYIMLAFLACYGVHFIYLGAFAYFNKHWWWLAGLFLMPLVGYFVYFALQVVKQQKIRANEVEPLEM